MESTTDLFARIDPNIDPIWREQQLRAAICLRDAESAKLRSDLSRSRARFDGMKAIAIEAIATLQSAARI